MRNKFFNYSKNENIQKFSNELSPQDYYNSYLGLWYFCLVLTFIAQVLSLGSEYAYFQNVFSSSLTGALLIGATVLFCLFIESAKYFIFGAFFKEMFLLTKSSVNPFLLALALLISAVSVYASIIGGGTFGIDTAKVITTESKHDKEIQAVRSEIAEIHKRNTWKGNTYIAGKDKALLHAKESELSKVKTAKEKELGKVANENEQKELTYRYWFGSFELVFVLCTWFVYYFKKRTAIECNNQSVPTDSQNVEPTTKVGFSQVPNSTIAPNSQIQKVGFQFGQNLTPLHENSNTIIVNENRINEGNRICKHCGNVYTYKHHKQVYCTEDCRIKAWEQRTGKVFNKKGGTK